MIEKLEGRDLAGRRNDVVGGLAAVDVVVGIDQAVIALLTAEQLNGAVGDDFIGVHVQGGAGAALDRLDDELIMQPAADDLIAGLDNGFGLFLVENAAFIVRDGAGLLDLGQAVDDFIMHAQACDPEILIGAGSLDAVVGIHGNLFGTD